MCAAKKTSKPAETVAENTTSKMLFNHLYEACNILRGPINQDEYKTYVIPLLFFKRISDTYDEETALAYEEYGEDVVDFDEDELHTFMIPDGCHWDDVRMTSENVGVAIVNSMISDLNFCLHNSVIFLQLINALDQVIVLFYPPRELIQLVLYQCLRFSVLNHADNYRRRRA